MNAVCQVRPVLNSPFDQVVKSLFQVPANEVRHAAFTPAVEILERAEDFQLELDLPGVDPAQIEIAYERGILSVSGKRAARVPAEGERVLRDERVEGRFVRRFELPDAADATQISASNQFGVLAIRIAKKPELAPRKISVRVA
jgi:HSP20 family protein